LARWGSTGCIPAIEVSEHDAIIVVSCHGNTAKGLKPFVFESLRAQTEPSEKSLIAELHHGKVFDHAKLNYFCNTATDDCRDRAPHLGGYPKS
jgi:hypothetical protein